MRLFWAINFETEIKARIRDVIEEFKLNSIQGKFVNEKHLHLTVEFLGEIQSNKVDLLKRIKDELEFEPFRLSLNKTGSFKRREGDIYWLGLAKNDSLLNIQGELHQRLIDKGFEVENREYRPHITIGRKVILKDGFHPAEMDNTVQGIEIDVNKIDLMKSEFVAGQLIHKLVY